MIGAGLSARVTLAEPSATTLVVCSPGSPGSTEEAQSRMDAFAGALSGKTGTKIGAVYDPSEQACAKRLAESGLGLVSMPFFLAHEKELGLHARLQAVAKGRPALERWVLVAQKGKVKDASGLDGFKIVSNAAFAPAFVKGNVIGSLGKVPASAKLVQTKAVLSSLRKAANGEPVAVVLDGTQEASLASLPFASKLEVVARSPEMPAGVIVTNDKVSPQAWAGLEKSLTGLGGSKDGAAALEGIETTRFEPVDAKAIATAQKAYADAAP